MKRDQATSNNEPKPNGRSTRPRSTKKAQKSHAQTRKQCQRDRTRNSKNYEQCLDQLLSLDIKQGYEKVEQAFEQLTEGHLKTERMLLKPISEVGRRLLQNGLLIKAWSRILSINPFLNYGLLCQEIMKKMVPGVTEHRQELCSFLKKEVAMSEEKNSVIEIKADSGSSVKLVLKDTLQKESNSIQVIEKRTTQLSLQTEADDVFLIQDTLSLKRSIIGTHMTQKPQNMSPFYWQLYRFLACCEVKPLADVRIIGVIEYDFKQRGLYSLMLVKINRQGTTCQYEKIALLPIQHNLNDFELLKELTSEYIIQALLTSQTVISDAKAYWVEHMREYFQE